MMKYEIFKDVVENAVLDYLPPEFQNSELHLKRVKKVNGVDYDGLVVRKEDTNVCPVINLTQLYEDYKSVIIHAVYFFHALQMKF